MSLASSQTSWQWTRLALAVLTIRLEPASICLVRRIPVATGLQFLSFITGLTLCPWVRWHTSLPGAAGGANVLPTWRCGSHRALLRRDGAEEQWSCGGWSSCPAVGIFLSRLGSRASLSGPGHWSALLQLVRCCPEPLPWARAEKSDFQDQRGVLTADVILVFLQAHA